MQVQLTIPPNITTSICEYDQTNQKNEKSKGSLETA